MTKPDDSQLVRAAAHLEQVLRKLEELSLAVCKMRLHDERSVTRAARELNLALEQPGQLATGTSFSAEPGENLVAWVGCTFVRLRPPGWRRRRS